MLNMDFACPKKGNRTLDATTVNEINVKRDPTWIHLEGLRTHGFGALKAKLQMQNRLVMNM